jgi:hypothetical protein
MSKRLLTLRAAETVRAADLATDCPACSVRFELRNWSEAWAVRMLGSAVAEPHELRHAAHGQPVAMFRCTAGHEWSWLLHGGDGSLWMRYITADTPALGWWDGARLGPADMADVA